MKTPLEDIEAKYLILEKLGEGGMGAVYKVRHRLLGDLRVVKVIRPVYAESGEIQERFKREARAAIQLRHPNIAQIHDFVTNEKGGAYLVMELIKGMTLKQLMAQGGPPPLNLAVEIADQGLAALQYLHAKGYIHRDVAPDNLMLTQDYEGRPRVKLIDLGLAKRDNDTLHLTATHMFVGKVRYSSPEIFRRPGAETTAKSDLYSFGLVLYELLTGVCPVRGSSFEELMTAHLLDPPPDFDDTDPHGLVPEGLRQVVLQALAKDPMERPASAEVFQRLLAPFKDPEELGYDVMAEWMPTGPLSVDDPLYHYPTELPTLDMLQPSGPQADGSPANEPQSDGVDGPSVDATRRIDRKGPKAGAGDSKTIPMGTPKPRWRLTLGISLGILVLAALLWLFVSGGFTPEDPALNDVSSVPLSNQGRLLLDAAPWARILSVEDSAGNPVPIGEDSVTPDLLSLPPGSYAIGLEHPDLSQPRIVRVEIPARGTARRSVELDTGVTVDDYFTNAGLNEALGNTGARDAQ